jgi:hypothetical protein
VSNLVVLPLNNSISALIIRLSSWIYLTSLLKLVRLTSRGILFILVLWILVIKASSRQVVIRFIICRLGAPLKSIALVVDNRPYIGVGSIL